MKKIWNLMLVALVILGAAACTENVDSVDLKSEGVSFYATIGDEDTRAYIEDENGDKKWDTVWEDGDILDVTVDGETLYTFTYNSTTGKFSSNDEGATSLIGENVKILSQTGGNRDSKAGKKAWAINTATVDNFANNATVKLEASISFFRYTYEGDSDVTFEVVVTDENIDPKPRVFQYDGDSYESVTISGVKGENFVGFWPQGNDIEAKLSYSIGGVKCKETTLNLAPGKVYNLGTLEGPKISDYSVVGTNNGWAAGKTPMYVQGDYVVAFGVVFEESSDKEGTRFKILGTNDNWIGTKNNAEVGKWRITGGSDIKIAAGEYDIYYAPNSAKYCIVAAGKELPAMPEFSISIIGQKMTGCENWNADLTMALDGDYYTRKGVTFAAENEFKLRISKDWDESYGMSGEAPVSVNIDTMYGLVDGGQNMTVAAGTYDIYFSYTTKEFYVLTVGTTPADLAIPQYKIYVFQHDNDWSPLYLYTWDTNDNKYTGNWSGSEATDTKVINGHTYSYWTMPRNATGQFIYAIANNGSSQTGNFEVGTLDKDYYLLLNEDVLSFIDDPNNPEPVVPLETYNIYVYQYNNNWNPLNLYTWSTSGNYGDWPGTTATGTEVINGYTYSYWSMPASATNQDIKAIANNGSSQTGDFPIGILNKDYYLLLNGNVLSIIDDPNNPEPEPEDTTRTIYLTFSIDWDASNAVLEAWVWGSTTADAWYTFEYVSDKIYKIVTPSDCTGMKILRRSPDHPKGSWADSDKWNMTGNISIPSDKNLCTINSWDNDAGSWSVYNAN